MTLGEKIVKLRSEKGLSSVQLTQTTGLSRGYLWQLETGGKTNPSLDILQKLARALGVTVSELSETPTAAAPEPDLPPGLAAFVQKRGRNLGVLKSDVGTMKRINFRGKQPTSPEDWELLFLFLKKWAR